MDKTTLHEFWNEYFKNPNRTHSLIVTLLDSTKYNKKLTSITINSLLSYLKNHHNGLDLINNLGQDVHSVFKKFVLNDDYQITKKDELLFEYAQTNFTFEQKHLFQRNNLNNPVYKKFEQKNKYTTQPTTQEPYSHKQVITILNRLFQYNQFTYKEAVDFIKQNQTTWDSEINIETGKLPNKYNDNMLQLLDSFNNWELFDRPDPDIKEFLQVASININDFFKFPRLKDSFLPWLTENFCEEEWEKFTSDWNILPVERKQKFGINFLKSKPTSYFDTDRNDILTEYKNFFIKMITQQAPAERLLWWTDVFLNDAMKFIPINTTNKISTFCKWLSSTHIIKKDEYDSIEPFLEKYDLSNIIVKSNNNHKLNKI